jgi:hypothetical protein
MKRMAGVLVVILGLMAGAAKSSLFSRDQLELADDDLLVITRRTTSNDAEAHGDIAAGMAPEASVNWSGTSTIEHPIAVSHRDLALLASPRKDSYGPGSEYMQIYACYAVTFDGTKIYFDKKFPCER